MLFDVRRCFVTCLIISKIHFFWKDTETNVGLACREEITKTRFVMIAVSYRFCQRRPERWFFNRSHLSSYCAAGTATKLTCAMSVLR